VAHVSPMDPKVLICCLEKESKTHLCLDISGRGVSLLPLCFATPDACNLILAPSVLCLEPRADFRQKCLPIKASVLLTMGLKTTPFEQFKSGKMFCLLRWS
jgi:hypothetical protein